MILKDFAEGLAVLPSVFALKVEDHLSRSFLQRKGPPRASPLWPLQLASGFRQCLECPVLLSTVRHIQDTPVPPENCIVLFLHVDPAIFVTLFVEVVSLMKRGPQ
ncbi:hypothetical protein FNAPI_9292 [Fusarium napiforme]|uniref:Uncharacterized protein n=1 Tax=Fusarium napiforme TaxID=42672 RepID=A0A8H5MY20_9HYPO|nr:hypothetical protein FNAPI_9292 [Fusarium napiforme]